MNFDDLLTYVFVFVLLYFIYKFLDNKDRIKKVCKIFYIKMGTYNSKLKNLEKELEKLTEENYKMTSEDEQSTNKEQLQYQIDVCKQKIDLLKDFKECIDAVVKTLLE